MPFARRHQNITSMDCSEYIKVIGQYIPRKRLLVSDLLRLAWGTDAGFYRLIPQAVVIAENEAEVSRLLADASRYSVPVTFRAAGTSLSGQSITDSILIVAGKQWEGYEVLRNGEEISLQPGIIGNRVNEILAPYGRIFTPDPASKGSAMVGGIIMNNSSGMNCGTHANADKVLESMRIVLGDGTVIDTSVRKPCSAREEALINELVSIRDEIRADEELVERINRKYSIKNVTGLNLRPFVAYDDPYDILAHVMVGSEGTLGFMSNAILRTGVLLPLASSTLAYFADMEEACRAVVDLKKNAPEVYSCELLDKKSLASVNDKTGDNLTALLIETRANTKAELENNIERIALLLGKHHLFEPVRFTDNALESAQLWNMRSGIFPAVGGTRPLGTTSLIEDIAFPIDHLPEATTDLARLIEECGYQDSCIYGHAFEGNYHFVIAQSFDTPADVEKYHHLIDELVKLVVDKYDGSLKAEHGTGRNMAPFVKKEWGEKAYEMMLRVKRAFDPQNILNPGVIFNDDPNCFIKNLKPLPLTNPIVDRCIECGFCEVNCVSCGFTLSARQRIVAQREITYLKNTGRDPRRLNALEGEYRYYGDITCAADGLCSLSCPMGINTGDLTHEIRERNCPKGSLAFKVGQFAANHLSTVESSLRPVLGLANAAHSLLGDKLTNSIGEALHEFGVPLWSSALPRSFKWSPIPQFMQKNKVVYFPSCINQTMGPSEQAGKEKLAPLVDTMVRLCQKAGYEVIFPREMSNLCCGMIWESKGMPEIANNKTAQLEKALWEASEGGRYPVLCDQSPCLHRMRKHIKTMHLYEPAEFITEFLAPNLDFHPVDMPVAVHVTCSTRLMGLGDKIINLAKRCSNYVFVPTEVGCCGFAGDKGLTVPELNKWGLRKLRPQIIASGVVEGYSNSRTCEIGLTTNSGVPYQSIVYLVDKVTTPKKNTQTSYPNEV